VSPEWDWNALDVLATAQNLPEMPERMQFELGMLLLDELDLEAEQIERMREFIAMAEGSAA